MIISKIKILSIITLTIHRSEKQDIDCEKEDNYVYWMTKITNYTISYIYEGFFLKRNNFIDSK